jgi:hypothetical protein
MRNQWNRWWGLVAGTGLMVASAAPANQAYLPRTGPAKLRFALARPMTSRLVMPPLIVTPEPVAPPAPTNAVAQASPPPPRLADDSVSTDLDLWKEFWEELQASEKATSVGTLVPMPVDPEEGAGTLTPQMLVRFFSRLPGQSNVIEVPITAPAPPFQPPATAAQPGSSATYISR